MGRLFRLLAAFAVCLACATFVAAQDPPALVSGAGSWVEDHEAGVELRLEMTRAVPWRLSYLDNPQRLVVDLDQVAWPADLDVRTGRVGVPDLGNAGRGWSRLTLPLNASMLVSMAELVTGPKDAVLTVLLEPASEDAFTAAARDADEADAPPPPFDASRGLRVMIDPGHGGKDPGAEVDGIREADLMLSFAQEFREVLLGAGVADVALTREADEFVALIPRITRTRAFKADVLISLHADRLPDGAEHVSGATVYTLSSGTTDAANAQLVARHERGEPLAGANLSGVGDGVTGVLLDIAWQETAPASVALAGALVEALNDRTGDVSPHPLRSANFTVLKAPDIPSVLLELGFLSSAKDKAKLTDPNWRIETQVALADGLLAWWAIQTRAD